MNFKNWITIIILCYLRSNDCGKTKKVSLFVDDRSQRNLIKLSTAIRPYINPRKKKENALPMIEYIDLEADIDFAKPLSKNHPIFGYPVSLLDFVVREIFTNASKNPRIENFVYLDMYLITPYMFGRTIEEFSAICSHSFKGRTIIMPIYLEKSHTVIVLLANTELKEFVYYNPADPQVQWSKIPALKLLNNFINLIYERNLNVVVKERIFCDKGWNMIPISEKFLPPKKPMDGHKDFGLHIIRFIDLLINDKFSFQCNGNLNNYRTEIQNYLYRILWNNENSVSIQSELKNNDSEYSNSAPPGEHSFPKFNYEDYINQNKDFTAPFDINPPKREMTCLLDYSVEMIIGMKKRKGKFLYLPMHLISPYLIDKKLEKHSQIYSYSFENRVVIMPIYRPTKHTIVLIANINKKIVEYYNPMDPNLKISESRTEVDKIFKRFMELFRKWYMKVYSNKENVICKDWKLIKTTTKIPTVSRDSRIFDFGLYAIQFIDYTIGHGQLSFQYKGGINDYYTILRDSIIQKMWDDYKNRMNKQMENLLSHSGLGA